MDPVRLSVDTTAALRLVSVNAKVVAVPQFKVEHCQTGTLSANLVLVI